MRIVSFTRDGTASWGVLDGVRVIDLGLRSAELAAPTFADAMRSGSLLDIAVACAGAPADWHPGDIQLAVPFAAPGKVLGVGLNYSSHPREVGAAIVVYPAIFIPGVSRG